MALEIVSGASMPCSENFYGGQMLTGIQSGLRRDATNYGTTNLEFRYGAL